MAADGRLISENVSKLKGNCATQELIELAKAGSSWNELREQASVVAVLASVPEQVVTVVHVVEHVSDADEDVVTVEQMVEQLETGDAEHELDEELVDEVPDEGPDVGDGPADGFGPGATIVIGASSGSKPGGPIGGITGNCTVGQMSTGLGLHKNLIKQIRLRPPPSMESHENRQPQILNGNAITLPSGKLIVDVDSSALNGLVVVFPLPSVAVMV